MMQPCYLLRQSFLPLMFLRLMPFQQNSSFRSEQLFENHLFIFFCCMQYRLKRRKDWRQYINDYDLIPIIVTSNTKIESYVKGYHAYKGLR